MVEVANFRYWDPVCGEWIEPRFKSALARIRAFRNARPSVGLARTLQRTVITTYGHDHATAMTEFFRDGSTRTGRQSQTWVRMPEGWRVVAAHVSVVELA